MHTLLIITKGELGGAQTHLLELCRALNGRVRFTAAIGGMDAHTSPLAQALASQGVDVRALPALCNSMHPWQLLKALRELLALLRSTRPEVIHAHSSVAGVVARVAGRITGTPVVYTVHGFGFKPEARRLTRWSAWLAEAALWAWTSRLICVSQHEQRLAQSLFMDRDRTCVIENAIDDVVWRARPDEEPARLIMVARMAAPKRHDQLLRALAHLRDTSAQQPALRLLGSGPQQAELQALADSLKLQSVEFAGDSQSVPEELARHQIFILLSDHEGLPISILEAMRAGMAILASRLPGVEELLEHGQSGWLVDKDPQDIARGLSHLLSQPALRARLGAQARQRYEERHRPERMAQAVLDVYAQAPLLSTSPWPMRLPRRHPAAMASERSRVQHAQLGWSVLGLSMLGLASVIGTWLLSLGWATPIFGQTVLACVIPYALAARLLYSGSRLPSAQATGLLLLTTAAPFVLTPLGFALLQHEYSRGAVLLCWGLTAVWFFAGWRIFHARRPLRLIYWHDEQPAHLQSLLSDLGVIEGSGVELLHWPDLWRKDPEQCPDLLAADGALNDPPRCGLDDTSQRILSRLKRLHLRLYSPESVAEALSGRIPRSSLQNPLWQIDSDPAFDLLKRLSDVLLVLLTAPAWMPLAALTGVLVRIDSPGPALFVQERTGRHGAPFRLFKFRSMRHESGGSARFAGEQDPRITRWGRFIRKTRLDELPQLWNVLRGDMSLIGPRPEQTAFVDQFAREIPSYPYRHIVRPGLTGWAQVHQGYAAGIEETATKLSYDLYYVTHYSLAMDLLIIAKTVRTVFTGRGAR